MQTSLAEFIRDTPDGREAERILRTCVHCGFCNATCPTYQVLGNELDGPRGRIYLVKQLLEGAETSHRTLTHLDRCLTCRACETTCPSGVEYAKLADIGRRVAEDLTGRPWYQRLARFGLRTVFSNAALAGVAFRLGRIAKPLLPRMLGEQIPPATGPEQSPLSPATVAATAATRNVLLLAGCVQSAAKPGTNAATRRVLARFGIAARVVSEAGCCGAIAHHLNAHADGLDQMRRNVDAWLPHLTEPNGAEALIFDASGCGAVIKDYGYLLRDDPKYAKGAALISERARDVSEILDPVAIETMLSDAAEQRTSPTVAYHPPCSLQHGLKVVGTVERLLAAARVTTTPVEDSHLCCGSAGTYSVLQPKLSSVLLDNKLAALQAGAPTEIVTANIGCQMHLARRAGVPVRHWIELLDEVLPTHAPTAETGAAA